VQSDGNPETVSLRLPHGEEYEFMLPPLFTGGAESRVANEILLSSGGLDTA
jgi:hypothetical protein